MAQILDVRIGSERYGEAKMGELRKISKMPNSPIYNIRKHNHVFYSLLIEGDGDPFNKPRHEVIEQRSDSKRTPTLMNLRDEFTVSFTRPGPAGVTYDWRSIPERVGRVRNNSPEVRGHALHN